MYLPGLWIRTPRVCTEEDILQGIGRSISIEESIFELYTRMNEQRRRRIMGKTCMIYVFLCVQLTSQRYKKTGCKLGMNGNLLLQFCKSLNARPKPGRSSSW